MAFGNQQKYQIRLFFFYRRGGSALVRHFDSLNERNAYYEIESE